jgi:hypothetical protein
VSGADLWEIQQHTAALMYESARYRLLQPILMHARTGALDRNWREQVNLDQLGYAMQPFADGNRLALHEIATMNVQPWEPYAGVGWRVALDSWYSALLKLDEDRARIRSGDPAENRALREFDVRVAEGWRRWRDWHEAQYYAGLAAGGLDVDWREWYRARIATWTGDGGGLEGPSASRELEQLDTGRLDYFEVLPRYWMS